MTGIRSITYSALAALLAMSVTAAAAAPLAEVEAQFDFDAATRALRVDYRVRNTGDGAIAVFDRGDHSDVAQNRRKAGTPGRPMLLREADTLTLELAASPLKNPTPTMPPSPLAARVAPSAELRGNFRTEVPQGIARLRLCVGVAPFDESAMSDPVTAQGLEIWRGSLAAVKAQTLLCSPWLEL